MEGLNSVKSVGVCGNLDQLIVYLARVSSEDQGNPNYKGLLKYLLREGHWSPFDMVNLVIEINTQKDVGIQILRHQTLKPQEWSQRYADCGDMVAGLRECRMQDTKDRQNSYTCEDPELIDWWIESQKAVIDLTFGVYNNALQKGVAKEVARSVLPIGLTNTKMYFNGSIRSWLFYVKSRLHKSTQKEHREVAVGVLKILLESAPDTTLGFIELFMSDHKEYLFDRDILGIGGN